jgi:hypothetical protein
MHVHIHSELCLAYQFVHRGEPWFVQVDETSATIHCSTSNEKHVVSVIKQRMPATPCARLNRAVHGCVLDLQPEKHAFVRALKPVQEVG